MARDNNLQEIAIRLYWNLHTGAAENIISSLLAASINTSKHFMKWFCKQAGLDSMGRSAQFYAEANGRIPNVMRRARSNKRVPWYADILIWREDEHDKWKNIRRDSGDEAKKAAKQVHVIFVEVKHIALPEPDKNKYINFLNSLSQVGHKRAAKGKLNKKHKFVIISSHAKQARDRLQNLNKGDMKKNEKQWYELTKEGENQHRVRHLVLEEMYDAIREHHQWYSECPILQLFKYYLALCLWKVSDDIFRGYWADLITDYKKDYDGLKWEIADSVQRLAEMTLIRTCRGHNLVRHRIRELGTIEFCTKNGKDYRLKFLYDSRATKTLKLKLSGADSRGPVELNLGNADKTLAGQITDAMNKVLSFVNESASR